MEGLGTECGNKENYNARRDPVANKCFFLKGKMIRYRYYTFFHANATLFRSHEK